eukprot:2235022-Prymnesium_polylepis.2
MSRPSVAGAKESAAAAPHPREPSSWAAPSGAALATARLLAHAMHAGLSIGPSCSTVCSASCWESRACSAPRNTLGLKRCPSACRRCTSRAAGCCRSCATSAVLSSPSSAAASPVG